MHSNAVDQGRNKAVEYFCSFFPPFILQFFFFLEDQNLVFYLVNI